MRHDSSLRAISNVLAVLVIAGGGLYGIEAVGFRTGLPEILVCRVGQTLMNGPVRGLIPWGLALGMLMLILPVSRGAGVSMLVLSIGALVVVDLWLQLTTEWCGSGTYGGGFTP